MSNPTSFPMPVQDGNETRIVMPGQSIWLKNPRPSRKPKKKKESTSHSKNDLTYGIVYANELARAEIEKKKPKFPEGSIIVREKNLTADAVIPETIIAMVKRKKGFSKKTGDWEFFVFNGKDLKLQKRETVGNCAECHSNTKKTDWVFKDYLK